MDHQRTTCDDQPARSGGPFAWAKLAFWLPACLGLGLMTAWMAAVAEGYFAPFLIFPLLVGVGLGAMAVGLVRVSQTGHRPTVLLGTVLAVAATVVGQHYFSYRAVWEAYNANAATIERARRLFPDDLQDRLAAPPPNLVAFLREEAARGRPLPGGYSGRGKGVWASWAVDALLVLGATLAMVIPALRQPYCSRCGSWYRVTRSGRIDVSTARRLAEIAEVTPVEESRVARYRLRNCNGGCGPTEFELSWDESPKGTTRVRSWLDVDRRNRMTEVLDEIGAVGHEEGVC
ncbi:MAG: hypothetical protein JXB62_04135 [Pirellulales bacterium]|nr:hypothetical protein [Pirellulales bacterium]